MQRRLKIYVFLLLTLTACGAAPSDSDAGPKEPCREAPEPTCCELLVDTWGDDAADDCCACLEGDCTEPALGFCTKLCQDARGVDGGTL